jgi:predicted RNase H-like HicB family nuclease
MKKKLFSVVIQKDKKGYVATCLDIQGCYSQGSTYKQVLANIKDVIKLCLSDKKVNRVLLEREVAQSKLEAKRGIGKIYTSVDALMRE